MSFLSGISGSYQKKLAAGLSMLPGDWRGKLSSWGLSAPIGSLGNIVFEVSSRKVRTFRDLKRTHKARFATHKADAGVYRPGCGRNHLHDAAISVFRYQSDGGG